MRVGRSPPRGRPPTAEPPLRAAGRRPCRVFLGGRRTLLAGRCWGACGAGLEEDAAPPGAARFGAEVGAWARRRRPRSAEGRSFCRRARAAGTGLRADCAPTARRCPAGASERERRPPAPAPGALRSAPAAGTVSGFARLRPPCEARWRPRLPRGASKNSLRARAPPRLRSCRECGAPERPRPARVGSPRCARAGWKAARVKPVPARPAPFSGCPGLRFCLRARGSSCGPSQRTGRGYVVGRRTGRFSVVVGDAGDAGPSPLPRLGGTGAAVPCRRPPRTLLRARPPRFCGYTRVHLHGRSRAPPCVDAALP